MSWYLVSGQERRREAPYTFFLPHPGYIAALKVGDIVKLLFEYEGDVEQYGGERMWVSIDRLTDTGYEGTLLSDPCEAQIAKGTIVQFEADHILDFQFDDDRPAPVITDAPREYWERCMVDDCVLKDGVPVEYIYREEPDLGQDGDKHPDSGWRIRGREGADSMADRKPAYVALGAVLNRDDSWLHLIDAPVGSAFMRNFATNEYEAVSR